ncbi:MAG: four helix bundle protein [Flavobacteriales bacterium]|nr:four helix bundle protein [Flavobacteriales bacterium]
MSIKSQKYSILTLIKNIKLDRSSKDQLRRVALSIPLNIAEGSGRFGKKDRRHFYVIARSSLFEVVAILDILSDEAVIKKDTFKTFYSQAEELSKILFALIKGLEK